MNTDEFGGFVELVSYYFNLALILFPLLVLLKVFSHFQIGKHNQLFKEASYQVRLVFCLFDNQFKAALAESAFRLLDHPRTLIPILIDSRGTYQWPFKGNACTNADYRHYIFQGNYSPPMQAWTGRLVPLPTTPCWLPIISSLPTCLLGGSSSFDIHFSID